MKNLIFILLCIISILFGAKAQSMYQTLEGHVVVSGKYQRKTVLAESHKLNLFLDYKTKEFRGKLDLNTLDTGIDSLNEQLAYFKPVWVLFSGVIPDDDFIIWEHPKLNFTIPLTVQVNGESLKPMLNVKLDHYEGSRTYACLLSGLMDLNISALEVPQRLLGDTILVKFTQVLMRRDGH